LLGLGFGAFPAESTDLMLRTPGVDLASFDLRPYGLRAHNTYLESLAELGIVGFVLFTGLLISCGRSLWRAARLAGRADDQHLRRLANALLVALVAWSISAVFLSVQTSRSLWMLVGLSIAVVKLTRPLGAQGRSLPRPPT
jgi:O-antigen ligase